MRYVFNLIPKFKSLGVVMIALFFCKTAMASVPLVSELSDVQPTDWAFQALQSLVERYGCIRGYPDGTYRGNQALSRSEFAVALNACLNQIYQLLQTETGNLITQNDLILLQRLQEKFAPELAMLRGKVQSLEARMAELEANQFSTTTKLKSEILFQAGDSFGGNSDESQTFWGYRVRIDFEASFTGEDMLITRLQARNLARLDRVTNTFRTRLGTDGSSDGKFAIDNLFYQFPVGEDGRILIGPRGLSLNDVGEVLSPLSSSSRGAVSRFGRRDPATLRGPGGTGLAFLYRFSDEFRVNVGYLASDEDASEATENQGLFNGSGSAIAQVVFEPIDDLELAITYTHKYFRFDDVNLTGSTGSFIASQPFGQNQTRSNSLGLQLNWEVISGFELGGWFGYERADQKGGGNDQATILNGALTFVFDDLWAEDNLGGIIIGIPPRVTHHSIQELEEDETSFHLEAIYRIQVNDNIQVTPGIFVITNPNPDENDSIWVGTLRTRFEF